LTSRSIGFFRRIIAPFLLASLQTKDLWAVLNSAPPSSLIKAYVFGTLWGGGCDAQRILASGTPAEVEAEVARAMEAFKPGGGYVFAGIHNIQGEVPSENVVALFETAFARGSYS